MKLTYVLMKNIYSYYKKGCLYHHNVYYPKLIITPLNKYNDFYPELGHFPLL
jgi:hypothetical protein